MKKFSLALGALLLLGAGCGGGSADTNNLDTPSYKLSIPDSATTTAIADGYRVQNYEDVLADNSYYIDFLQDGTTVDSFLNTYPDAEESTLGLNDGAVWMATGYRTDDTWTEDAYFHEDSGTLIVQHYTEPQGIVLAELLVGAITWK